MSGQASSGVSGNNEVSIILVIKVYPDMDCKNGSPWTNIQTEASLVSTGKCGVSLRIG